MRTARLIAASWRLAWSPSSRPIIICLLVFALLLPLVTWRLMPPADPDRQLPTVDISVVSSETGNDMLNTIEVELGKIDLIDHVYVESKAQAKARLARNETLLYIEFPADFFVDSLAALKREQVVIVLNENMPTEAEFFSRMADEIGETVTGLASAYYAYADLMAPYYAPEALRGHLDLTMLGLLMRLLTRNRLVTAQTAPKFDLVAFASASMLVIIILLAGMLPLFFAARDDKLGLSARFLASGLNNAQIAAARLLAGLPLAVLAVAPMLAIVNAAFGYRPDARLLAAMLLLYAAQSLLALLAARLDTASLAPVLLTFGVTFLHMLAGGVIYPVELLPPAVAAAGKLTPVAELHRLAVGRFGGQAAPSDWLILPAACLILALLLGLSWRLQRRRPV